HANRRRRGLWSGSLLGNPVTSPPPTSISPKPKLDENTWGAALAKWKAQGVNEDELRRLVKEVDARWRMLEDVQQARKALAHARSEGRLILRYVEKSKKVLAKLEEAAGEYFDGGLKSLQAQLEVVRESLSKIAAPSPPIAPRHRHGQLWALPGALQL